NLSGCPNGACVTPKEVCKCLFANLGHGLDAVISDRLDIAHPALQCKERRATLFDQSTSVVDGVDGFGRAVEDLCGNGGCVGSRFSVERERAAPCLAKRGEFGEEGFEFGKPGLKFVAAGGQVFSKRLPVALVGAEILERWAAGEK